MNTVTMKINKLFTITHHFIDSYLFIYRLIFSLVCKAFFEVKCHDLTLCERGPGKCGVHNERICFQAD